MAGYYSRNNNIAKEGGFTVWISIGVPIELLMGFDMAILIPENFSAASSAKSSSLDMSLAAESAGYSIDLCSYTRISMGATFLDNDKKNGDKKNIGMPLPDLLISNTDNCSLLVKWFDVFHRKYNIPHFTIDTPFCYIPQQKKDLEFLKNQYQDLIQLIEKLSGQKFSQSKVEQAQQYSYQGVKYWKKFLEAAAHKPAAITAFDAFMHMAPYVVMRGTPEMVEHYKILSEEVAQRIQAKEFAVPQERYRLLWDNIAPWHQLKSMANRLATLNANMVYATYTSCIGSLEGEIEQFAPDVDPLHWLARAQNSTVCPYGLNLRVEAMKKMIDKYQIDGIVYSSNISCKPYSLMQMDQVKIIKEKFGVPGVLIDMDHADKRKYSEENTFLRIEALLEEIEQNA